MSRSDRSPMRMKVNYHHPDLGDDPLPDDFATADYALAQRFGAFFLEHYPGHPFRCLADHKQGVATVYISELMGAHNRFIIKIADIKNELDFLRWANRACGEILERYKLPRGRFSRDDWRAALAKAPIIGLNKTAVPE